MNAAGLHRNASTEIQELRERLRVAESTIEAIRNGQIDAVVVSGPQGERVYTLEGADRPYRMLFQEMHEGAVIASSEGFILYANAQFAHFVGAPLEQVIGSAFATHVEPAYLALIETALVRSRERPVRFEACLRRQGTEIPVQISITTISLDESYACIVVTDLTVLRQNEELTRSEALARAILEQVTESVVVTDLEGRIIRASNAAVQLAGRDILFDSFPEVFPLACPGGDALDITAASCSGTNTERCTMTRSDGTVFDLLVRRGELTDSTRSRIGTVVTLSDVTPLHRAEQELRDSVAKLRVANSDLKQFAYAASHDLQEPIRMMTAFTQMMGTRYRGRLDADFDQMLGYVLDGSQRMNTLLRDLLMYLSAGEVNGKCTDNTDCGAAARMALANLSELFKQSGATIHFGDLPQVQCVFTHVLQIFQNLFSNALKYRRDQAPEICVSAEPEGTRWIISVRDNGIGIAPEYHDRIFGVFKRLHGKEIPGTGIGLAICQKIADQYHGRIWVESIPGQGATFRVSLPAVEQ